MQVLRRDGETTLHDAFDPELGHKVALVTCPIGPDAAEEGRLAFRLRKMRHPNIVPVLDAGRQDGVAFVAAECLETEPLSALVARAGRIPVFHGLALALQLLSAIGHAQARRMVHATVDLEHVQVTRTGQLKLPAAGWSLASDRQPNLEAAARIAQVLLSGPCPPRMRRALDDVLLRAQGPDPQARYRCADDFILALLAAAGRPVWNRTPAVERSAAVEPVRSLAPSMERPVVAEPEHPARSPVPSMEPPVLAEAADPVWNPVPSVDVPVLAEAADPVWDPVSSMEGPVIIEAGDPVWNASPAMEGAVAAEAADPLWSVAPAVERALPAESETPSPSLVSKTDATHASGRARRTRLHLRHPVRHVLAACLVVALLVPHLVGNGSFTGSKEEPRSQAALPPQAPAAPEHVALAPAAPERVALAPILPAEPSPAPRSPAAPSPAAPSPTAPSVGRAVAVAPPAAARQPKARTATRQRATHARPAPPARQVRASKPATTRVRAVRPHAAPALATASGCAYASRKAGDRCDVKQCSRPELRRTPACVRALAQQRAALERLRGTPD